MAIGRLDYDSEGLLLLTTDGKLSEQVRSKKVEKEYFVQVDGIITTKAIQLICEGVEIRTEGITYRTKRCTASILTDIPTLPERAKKIRDQKHGPTSWISVSLREGKFRQVRKMTAVVGFPTLRLVRVRIGNVTIDGMDSGEAIPINDILF